MNPRLLTLAAASAVLLATAAIAVSTGGCTQTYTLTPTFDSDSGVPGPTGQSYALRVVSSGASAGLAVTFSALPSTVTVSPASVTTDATGTAVAYVLVPYGTGGVVTVSAPFATTSYVPVQANPLTLCSPGFQAVNDGGAIGPLGEVYTVSVQALTSGMCPNANAAPAGVSISLTTSQPSTVGTGAVAATLITNDAGVAETNVVVPWGANLLAQAVAGPSISQALLPNIANPITLPCLYWNQQQQTGLYELNAQAAIGSSPVPAAPISFSIVYPAANAGTVMPSAALTNDAGVATAFVGIPASGSLPVVVEAMVGSAALTTTLIDAGSGDSGTCF